MIHGHKLWWKHKSSKSSPPTLKDVSFVLQKGRITTFMGRSGAGKTTLLKCIANLHPHYEGTITCEDKDVKKLNPSERASTIGFVLQQFHLFPHLTVLKNCTYALVKSMGIDLLEAENRAIECLDLLSMKPFIGMFPTQLSGGQQQRIAIARALVLQPKILLLDEPTSALDPDSKKSLESLLIDLRSRGITLALSSHDMPFIQRVTDCIYFMEQGELIEQWDCLKDDLLSKQRINQFIKQT